MIDPKYLGMVWFPNLFGEYYMVTLDRSGWRRMVLAKSLPFMERSVRHWVCEKGYRVDSSTALLIGSPPEGHIRDLQECHRRELNREFRDHVWFQVTEFRKNFKRLPKGFVSGRKNRPGPDAPPVKDGTQLWYRGDLEGDFFSKFDPRYYTPSGYPHLSLVPGVPTGPTLPWGGLCQVYEGDTVLGAANADNVSTALRLPLFYCRWRESDFHTVVDGWSKAAERDRDRMARDSYRTIEQRSDSLRQERRGELLTFFNET